MSSLRFDTFARAAMLGLFASQAVACGGAKCGGEEIDESSDDTTGDDVESQGSGGDLGSGGGSGIDTTMTGILSSQVVPGLTLEVFTLDCQEAGGVVETHAGCGGSNTGKGFSYDLETEVYTEHTCAGYNTCSGFSCVIPE